jgi:hypothetical protein
MIIKIIALSLALSGAIPASAMRVASRAVAMRMAPMAQPLRTYAMSNQEIQELASFIDKPYFADDLAESEYNAQDLKELYDLSKKNVRDLKKILRNQPVDFEEMKNGFKKNIIDDGKLAFTGAITSMLTLELGSRLGEGPLADLILIWGISFTGIGSIMAGRDGLRAWAAVRAFKKSNISAEHSLKIANENLEILRAQLDAQNIQNKQ